MKSIVSAAAACMAAMIPSLVHAIPSVFYHPGTGGIWLSNDTGANLGAIAVISAGNKVKTEPALFAAIPGATFDPGDLPSGFTYLKFPPTNSPLGVFVGNVVMPGTPYSDLSGVYYESLSTGVQKQLVNFYPAEPASSFIALLGVVATVTASRHRRRR